MRRFLSGLLYLALGLPVALSGLLALSLRPWALDRDFYSRAIDDQRLWDSLRSPVALKGAPDKVEIGGYIFSGPALYGALQKHLPEAELRSVATNAIDEALSAAESGGARATVNLRPLKSALSRDSAAIATDYFAALPPGIPAEASGDLSVKPAAAEGARFLMLENKAIGSIISKMPDEIRPEVSGPVSSRAHGAKISPRAAFDRLSTTGVAAAAVLLLGLGFLGGGGLGPSLARTGRYLIYPSALVLAAGIALSIPGAPIALNFAAHSQAAGELGFFHALGGWLGSWLGVAARSFFVVGLSSLSLGALLASVRRILEPREY